jgi:hypothetical protein
MIDVGHDGGERFSGLTGGGCHRIDVSMKCDPTKYFDSSLLSAGGLPATPSMSVFSRSRFSQSRG